MKKVLLLLIEGFETYEASVFIDVIGWNLVDGDHQTRLYTCGLKREVKSSFDQRMVVDHLLDEIAVKDWDALAIPGGFEEYRFYDEGFDPRVQALIRGFAAADKPIASVCVGALVVAKSGVLVGKRATTYNQKPIRQQALADMGAIVVDAPVVVDGRIITSWNPSSAMEVAFRLLQVLTDQPAADHIRTIMGFNGPRPELAP
jgi:4-methyl-5(b-hydroxyethyl)-thiazole monophosphate biosynthesis